MSNNEFFDFDKLFEEFMRAKFSGRKDINPELIKAQLGKLYHHWSETPLQILGGKTPANYYKDIDCPQTLIDFLVRSCENGRTPNSFLLDSICESPACVPLLTKLVSSSNNSTLTITAIELLQLMNAPHPLNEYLEILLSNQDDRDLRDLIIEVLIENSSAVKESIFALLPTIDIEQKTLLAEVLANAGQDARTTALLTELFISLDNIPIISSFIGKYGDESLAAILYKALDTCNYMEYIEIKNAIERLGGIVEDTRDFSDDPYYRVIKGI